MSFLSVTKACRPIRLGFLVRPGHKEDLRTAVAISTVTWGGVFNPFIPLYKRVPPVWKDRFVGGPTAVEVLRGYIATFQPDFLVLPTGSELPEGVFPRRRLLEPEDVLSPFAPDEPSPTRSCIRFGVDVTEIYEEAYRKAFRFVQRHPPESRVPRLRGGYELLAACLWGAFPAHKELAHYERDYTHVFDAERTDYRALDTLLFDVITPLKLTAHGLEPNGRLPEPSVFVLDESNVLDLIDFWNLRACGGPCVPLPLSRITPLSAQIKGFMERHARKHAVNSPKPSYPALVASRSLGADAARTAAKALSLSTDCDVLLGNYPRLWAKQEAAWDQWLPVSFEDKTEYDHIEVDGSRTTLGALHPEFAVRFGRGGPRWVNVISMNDHDPSRLPANVIPDDLQAVDRILGKVSLQGMWTCDEGVVVCCEHKDWRHHWELPDASRIGQLWAEERGYELVTSDAGNTLQSMVEAAGGLFQGRWFANKDIIQKLGEMCQGQVVSSDVFRGAVNRANQAEAGLGLPAGNHLQYFQDRGILQLCIRIPCPHCGKHPSYTLEELAHTVECRFCLRRFSFPIANPPADGWQYRSVGPFTAKGFAQGAYSVFLALRFLTDQLEATTTCVPSCELVKDGLKLETDFICFWHKPSSRDRGRHVVFGECKCFGDFQHEDVGRMEEIANRFPNCIIAFCTLKESLKPKERRLLRGLAERGRKPRRGVTWPMPVLVLTGNELCVMNPGSFCHQVWGGEATGLARRMPRGDLNMLDLCSASQEEYLGLPSWYTWLERWISSSGSEA